jgi:hypothetical protein
MRKVYSKDYAMYSAALAWFLQLLYKRRGPCHPLPASILPKFVTIYNFCAPAWLLTISHIGTKKANEIRAQILPRPTVRQFQTVKNLANIAYFLALYSWHGPCYTPIAGQSSPPLGDGR